MWKLALIGALGTVACLPAPSDDSEPADEGLGPDGNGSDADIGFVLDEDWDGHVLSITWLSDSLSGDGSVATGAQLASTEISGRDVLMSLPQPDGVDLVEIDPDGAPGMLIAMYTATIHDDEDGDGTHDEGERIVSVGMWLPTWVQGDIPAEYQVLGTVPGWNALDTSTMFGVIDVDPNILTMTMTSNMEVQEALEIKGRVTEELADHGRITLKPILSDGDAIDALLDDQPLDTTWSLNVSGSPPSSHENDTLPCSKGNSAQLPTAYKDLDGSESFGSGDDEFSNTCHGDQPAVLIWAHEPDGVDQAMSLALNQLQPGWSLITVDDKGQWTVQDPDEVILEVRADCVWGE